MDSLTAPPATPRPACRQYPAQFGGQYGYYTDTETGLLCLTHRYYDPGTGKFVNRDPIGYRGGINLYGFCGNNPVNQTDPNGTDSPGDWIKKQWHKFWFGNGGHKGPGLGNVNHSYDGLVNDGDDDGLATSVKQTPGYNLPQNSHKLVTRENAVFTTVAVGILSAPLGGGGRTAEEAEGVITPWCVRFTQKGCNWKFKSVFKVRGLVIKSIGDMAHYLKTGELRPEDVEPIRLVIDKEGRVWTLDNRRLEAFKRAGINIRYRMATPSEIRKTFGAHMDNQLNGMDIVVRGEPK